MRDFRPSIFGKANTGVQILALLAVLLCQIFLAPSLILLRSAALDTTAVLTIVSAVHYAWRTAPTARRRRSRLTLQFEKFKFNDRILPAVERPFKL